MKRLTRPLLSALLVLSLIPIGLAAAAAAADALRKSVV